MTGKEPAAADVTNADPLRMALMAMDAARDRLATAQGATSALGAYSAAAETVWWACAIDEQLEATTPERYEAARDVDEQGRVLLGLRWVRDRLTHQLPITTDYDTRPFFPPPGAGYLIANSKGFFWRPAIEIRTNPGRDATAVGQRRRRSYEEHVAGRKVTEPVWRAYGWLERAVQSGPHI